MKKSILLSISAVMLFFTACKKDNNSSPSNNNNNNNNNNNSPYYFKFGFNGTNYDFNLDFGQYMYFETNSAGGYQSGSAALFPSVGLRLRWPENDTVRDGDIMALIGKTLYFNDTATIRPELSFDLNTTDGTWYSQDTANANFNVKITNVVFLKNDTALGSYPVKTYVITGTCNALMYRDVSLLPFTSGDFNFIISRRDL